ncbi:hypothetical protein HDV01_005442 [Terramyces sp. JEL0728]|nr:hypothetical protein HDV01_005442 [Terramyces sp. JEL0728]
MDISSEDLDHTSNPDDSNNTESEINKQIVQNTAVEANMEDTSNVVTSESDIERSPTEETITSGVSDLPNIPTEISNSKPQIVETSNAAVKHISIPNLQNVTIEEERPILINYINPEQDQPNITFKSQYIQQQSFIPNPQIDCDEFSLNEDVPLPKVGSYRDNAESTASNVVTRLESVDIEPHCPFPADIVRYGSLGGKINLMGLLKEAELRTREKAIEVLNERRQETPDTQSEAYEIQTVITVSVLGNAPTSSIGNISRIPKWNRKIEIKPVATGKSQIPIVKNRENIIANAMEKLKTQKSPILEKFKKKANILRLVTNRKSTKNMLLTNKGLFSEVIIKNPKTEEERNMKIWFKEEQSQSVGVILPQLDSRPISRQVLSKFHKDHSGDRPPDKNFSVYSQPLPRFRGPSFWPKEETEVAKRHKLLNEIKIQREIGSEVNESGFPVLGSAQNRRLKTAEVLSAIEALDQFAPSRHFLPHLEKQKPVFPNLEELRLEDIKDTGFNLHSIHLENRRVNSRAATSRNTSRYGHRIQTANVRITDEFLAVARSALSNIRKHNPDASLKDVYKIVHDNTDTFRKLIEYLARDTHNYEPQNLYNFLTYEQESEPMVQHEPEEIIPYSPPASFPAGRRNGVQLDPNTFLMIPQSYNELLSPNLPRSFRK